MRIVSPNTIAIEALKCQPDKARTHFKVTGRGNDGLLIYVAESGSKTFYARDSYQGRPPRDFRLGTWPDMSIEKARERKSVRVLIDRGEDPWEIILEERNQRQGSTLDELFEEWMDHPQLSSWNGA